MENPTQIHRQSHRHIFQAVIDVGFLKFNRQNIHIQVAAFCMTSFLQFGFLLLLWHTPALFLFVHSIRHVPSWCLAWLTSLAQVKNLLKMRISILVYILRSLPWNIDGITVRRCKINYVRTQSLRHSDERNNYITCCQMHFRTEPKNWLFLPLALSSCHPKMQARQRRRWRQRRLSNAFPCM